MSDKELIEEARLAACNECSEEGTSPAMRCDGDLIRRLADALEDRQPTEDDREVAMSAARDGLMSSYTDHWPDIQAQIVDSILAAGFSRAAVPDAATEGDYHEGLEEGIKIGRAECDAAVAAIERLDARHRKIEASAVTGDCAIEECEHEDECPTEVFEVCAACWNLCESADPYFGERGIAPVLWPCEIATALDGAPEPEEKP